MSGDSGRRTAGRADRIRSSLDFVELKAAGRRMACGSFIANWRVRSGGGVSRLGLVASRRIGGAVVRNRAKRLLREVFRLRRGMLAAPVDLVLVALPPIVGCCLADVDRQFVQFLRRARLLRAGGGREGAVSVRISH